jgi:DNA-binding PucR family transcriptional regulator
MAAASSLKPSMAKETQDHSPAGRVARDDGGMSTHDGAGGELATESDRLLTLLAEDAPAEMFEQLVVQARQRGGEPGELARLEAGVATALRVRSILEERRRRESELAALYETANDLSALREVEQVLQAIVRRARQLIASDVAYLMLIDEARGDTYMRVTEGIVTDEFKRVRLDLGAGLGGLVAQTARPYSTPDYLSDTRFVHTVDPEVAGERLVAILGVPLKLGAKVIGVLFAANRRYRPFAPEEVALLSSLAAHAAIAIENARLFAEAQEALRDLTAANALIRAHSEATERAAQVHERLTSLVLRGGRMADVAAAIAEVLGGDLLVVDQHERLVAAVGETPDALGRAAAAEGALPASGAGTAALRRALGQARRTGRTVRAAVPRRLQPRWVTPIVAGAEQLGALLLACDHELVDADLRSLERAAQVTALLLLNERSLAEAEHRVRGELLDDLLAEPRRDPEGLRRRATLLGLDLDREHAVVVARPSDTERRRAALAEAVALARELGGLAGEHGGSLMLLLPDTDPAGGGNTVARRLSATLGSPVTAGVAGPAAGVAGLVEAHAEASRCLRVLLALGWEGRAAGQLELGVSGLLLGKADRDELDRLVARTLGPVLEYDAQHRSDLAGTLEVFFNCGGNLTRAAAALYVHVNTLYQRLDRVGRLLGPGWRESDRALELQLALKVHRMTQG